MTDESLSVVREILDLLISQCQNFNDSFNNEQIDLHTSNKSEEKLTEHRPVIRLAKFAVDPSLKQPEERKNSIFVNQKKKTNTLSPVEAILDTVVPDCAGCIESDNDGKFVHAEDDIESQTDIPALASPEFPGLSNEIDLKTDIIEDIDDKQILTIDLNDENQPSTSTGFKKEIDLSIETIEILDDDEEEDEKSTAKSKAHKVCFKYMEHEKFSFYNFQQRYPTSQSKPEPYVILTSSVEAEKMIATKLFISKSNFDHIEALNIGDWVWLMAQFTFYSGDSKELSRVRIELQGVPAFTAFVPKDIDEVDKCIQSKANFVLSKKRISHILKCYQDVSHRICRQFIRHGKPYFVNCSEALGLEWIGLMFEYDETVFRRNKFVKIYPHLKQSFIASTERFCKISILDQYSYNATDLSASNAKLVDNIVGKLEVMIREKLDGRTYQETELQKQEKYFNKARNSKVRVIQPKGNEIQVKKNSKIPSHIPPTFICPQVHKHKCSQTFSFTSHEDVTKLLEHLDIPAAVRDLQYKDLKERLKTNPKDTLFKDCFYNKNKSNKNSSLFYIFCDAENYGDIVSDDMLAAIKKNLKRANMKQSLMQYMTFLSEKDPSPSTSASIDPASTSATEEEIASTSVPLLQFFQCPQKYKHSCTKNFALGTFKDVSIMLRHLEISIEVMQRQYDKIKKIYQDTISSSCPFCNCNLLVRDGFCHFEQNHSLVSALFYLYSSAEIYRDIKDFSNYYGDQVSSQLPSIRKVLPEDLKYHLDRFLNFQKKKKNDQSQATEDRRTELSAITDVSEVVPEKRKVGRPRNSLIVEQPPSSSFVMHPCPQRDKHKCEKSFHISSHQDVVKMSNHIDIPAKAVGFQLHHLLLMAKENGRTGNLCPIIAKSLSSSSKSSETNEKNAVSKKKKRLQCSQTRGVVTDVELDKIVKNYDKEGPSSEEKLRRLVKKRQDVKRSMACSQEELRKKRLAKNISKFVVEINKSIEEDEDDPLEVNFEHDDVISISPEPSENITVDSSKVSAEIIHVETEPLRSQTFSSFDEMLGITEDRTQKRKHEEDFESDSWKKLKSSDTQSNGTESFKSSHSHRYIVQHI